MVKANFHTHSTFCDGKDSPEEIARFAVLQGFTHLGFSGHMDPDIHMDFPAYLSEINRLKSAFSECDILAGVELDLLYDASSAEGAEYVIGSTHFLDVPSEVPASIDSEPGNIALLCRQFFSGDHYKMAGSYYELES